MYHDAQGEAVRGPYSGVRDYRGLGFRGYTFEFATRLENRGRSIWNPAFWELVQYCFPGAFIAYSLGFCG